jgi:hypothetical protein
MISADITRSIFKLAIKNEFRLVLFEIFRKNI